MSKEAVQGKKVIYLFRRYNQGTTQTGKTIAFTTENSRSVSKDADSTITKDGTIRTPNAAEIEMSLTSVLVKGDTMIDTYEDAFIAGELFEIWEANLDEPVSGQTNKFKGRYYQGYMTSFEKTSNAEDFVEITCDFGINGNGATGNVTVTTEEQEAAAYVFADTVKRMVISPTSLSIAEGSTGAITCTQAAGTITATASGTGITATVSTNTVTVSAASTAEDGSVVVSDGVTAYTVPVTISE